MNQKTNYWANFVGKEFHGRRSGKYKVVKYDIYNGSNDQWDGKYALYIRSLSSKGGLEFPLMVDVLLVMKERFKQSKSMDEAFGMFCQENKISKLPSQNTAESYYVSFYDCYLKNNPKIETIINSTQSDKRNFIYIPEKDLKYFPQKYAAFTMIDSNNGEEYVVHLEESNRIPGLTTFFESNPEILEGTKILIETIEPYKIYKIYYENKLVTPSQTKSNVVKKSAIERMAKTAMDTANGANGQQILRVLKNKEVRFPKQDDFEKYITTLVDDQHGLCAITKLKLQFDEQAEDKELLCSLDRIDSDGHYEAGNLQVICRFVNRWKSDENDAEFRRLMSLVLEERK